ncbi:dhp1-interacting protein [Moniliophthora roreri MCA 2997]|uniref:Decapping nuclease n=2 Tax=Moniliophthora roreri TaxID=221103 RepID=V2Y586_MONRO|nr:dhp1-interacting protein [Moniliophthora roreri MCA 2997]KAI3605493.1 dhp1-interacting protein [Moniliophthora roreri]
MMPTAVPRLGDCKLIAHMSLEEDGSYTVNDDRNMRLLTTSAASRRVVYLYPRMDEIRQIRPSWAFTQPKYIDSVVWSCIATGRDDLLRAGNGIVTRRGILSRIFLGDFPITLHVSYIDGNLYMEEDRPDLRRDCWKAHNFTRNDATGMAFEETFSKIKPSDDTSSQGKSSFGAQWANVVSRSFGSMNLIFSGEVDAVKDWRAGCDWFERRIELKCKLVGTKVPYDRWHMQSYLLGVPEIFVGYHTWNLQISHTDTIRTAEIKTHKFDGHIARGYRALSSLRSYISREQSNSTDDTIWRVTVDNGRLANVQKLSPSEAETVKKRREDSSRTPIERIGIVPKSMIDALRDKGSVYN